MNFRCYSEQEDMGRCDNQCEFCNHRYARPETKFKIEDYRDQRALVSDEMVSSRVPKHVYLKLKKICALDNRTMSNLILTMILNELKEINYNFEK